MVTLDEGGWAAGGARLEEPPAGLAEIVEHVFTVDFREARQRAWKILPDTSGHIVLKVGPEARPGRRSAGVVGSRTRATTADVRSRCWTVGVRFRPGALAELISAPAHELTDRSVPLGAVWGSAGDRLEQDVTGARDPAYVKARLVEFLRGLRRSRRGRDWRARAFATISRESGGRTRVGEAARRMGISSRALRCVAHEALGLAPKRYARIERLFLALSAPRNVPWSMVAARAGFSDQAHLVRDFKDLLGEAPTDFAARGRADSYKTEA